MSERIPFNKPVLAGREFEYMTDAIERGHISGDGYYTKRCSELLERTLGVRKVLLTTSCTHALEMAALLLDVKAGDEVIVPSFTFVSTVNAFVLRGATPVFADIRADTLNIDERQVDALVTPRTRVVLTVHYAGVACEMDPILETARRHHLAVVEDNAHGLFGKYRGRWLGTMGTFAAQSFHETKNLSCGEGGALLINDGQHTGRAEIIREKGTDRSRFFRGEVDRYSWIDVGSSYLPSDLLAAFLYAQLEARSTIQARRRHLWDTYQGALGEWAIDRGARTPTVPADCQQPYHMFYLVMATMAERDALLVHLRNHGILGVFHYLPLHTSPMGARFGGRSGACPVAEDMSARLLRLPFFNNLASDAQQQIIETIHAFRY